MTPSFYGSVLKAIACTPNRNPDAAAYTAEVLPKARRLRERVEDVLRTHPGLPAAAHFLGISHG